MTATCVLVLEALPRGPLAPELQAHTRDCAHCRASVDAFRLLGPVPPPSARPVPPPGNAILGALAAPPPRAWWKEALAVTAIILAVAAGVLLATGMRGSFGDPALAAATASALLALIAVGTWAALSPRGRTLRLVAVGLALASAGLIVAGANGEGAGASFWSAGWPCLWTEVASTLPPVAVLVWLLTRSAPTPLKTLVAALAGGAAGLLALHLHCPIRMASHLVVFHLLPWAALAALAVLVRRSVRTRSFVP